MIMASVPSTTAFPAEPRALERHDLDVAYSQLRRHYRSLMISRGVYRSQAQKSRAAMGALEERLRTMAAREASIRVEAYEMLEIVNSVIGELEDAGDDLSNEFQAYQQGKQTYAGGRVFASLLQAVIRFIGRWSGSKTMLNEILTRQSELKHRLDQSHSEES